MKSLHVFLVASSTAGALCLQSCTDPYASGYGSQPNNRSRVYNGGPGQMPARLPMQRGSGMVYYPIHHAITRGDADETFRQIRMGAPTVMGSCSLAYNAKRVNQDSLARQLAAAGYGTEEDIQDAERINESERRTQERNTGLVIAGAALLGAYALSGSGSSSSSDDEDSYESRERQRHADYESLEQQRKDNEGIRW